MASDVTLTQAAQNVQRTEAQSLKLAEDFDEFLTLLTTQLQNQDPLNPMDSSEFTNQIVQFSQVEQAINQNQKLDDLVGLQLASISSVALGYVGLDVSYRSAEMNFDGENPVKINYAITDQVKGAQLNIIDEEGNIVLTEQVPSEVGGHEFIWDGAHNGDGTVGPGTYSIRIDATDPDGGLADVSTVVTGRVRGIESQDGIILVLIGERAVPINSIINATLPGQQITASDETNANDVLAEDTTTQQFLSQDQINALLAAQGGA
jgi:flagellar basal-body rod modification protein FlgD